MRRRLLKRIGAMGAAWLARVPAWWLSRALVPKLAATVLAATVLAATVFAASAGTPTEFDALEAVGAARPIEVASLAGAHGTVFVFVRTDCPIANRYAPELERLRVSYTPRGIALYLVYVDPDEDDALIAQHLTRYRLGYRALRDRGHRLVAATGAKVTPEAAVYDAGGELVYAGRIDDRFVDFGKGREQPSQRELVDALEALLAGRAIARARVEAIGCYIGDLKR